jgi:hypothetical protein
MAVHDVAVMRCPLRSRAQPRGGTAAALPNALRRPTAGRTREGEPRCYRGRAPGARAAVAELGGRDARRAVSRTDAQRQSPPGTDCAGPAAKRRFGPRCRERGRV